MVDAVVTNLRTLVLDERRSIEDMLDIAKRISPVVQGLQTSEAAYEQAFESDTAPPVPGPSGSLQGFALLFFGASFLSLVLVGCLYAWWFTGSIKNVAIVFGVSLAIGLLTMGLLQRYG